MGSFLFPCDEDLEEFKLHSFDKWTMVSWILNENSISADVFIPIFSRYQKLFFSVMKLQHRFRRKKYVHYDAFDMELNHIENIDDSSVIQLVEDNTIYTFRDRDLFHICYNALINGFYLFPCPKVPKNPWTNKEFSEHNVYNILLYLKTRNKINMLLCSYLECNLDINLFSCKHFHDLQKILIYQRIERMEIVDVLSVFLELFLMFIKEYEIIYSTLTPNFVLRHHYKIRFIVKLYYIFLYTSPESTLYEYNRERFLSQCYKFILDYDNVFVKIPNITMELSGNIPL